MKLTEDFEIHYTGNPNEKPPKPQALVHEIEDQLDTLRANGKRITDCIYDGDDKSLNSKEAHLLGHLLARVMTCKVDDRSESIDNLRELFTRPLTKEAEELAEEFIND